MPVPTTAELQEKLRKTVMSAIDNPGDLTKYLSIIDDCYKAGSSFNEKDASGKTLLLRAIKEGSPTLVKKLIELGAEVILKNIPS